MIRYILYFLLATIALRVLSNNLKLPKTMEDIKHFAEGAVDFATSAASDLADSVSDYIGDIHVGDGAGGGALREVEKTEGDESRTCVRSKILDDHWKEMLSSIESLKAENPI